MCFLSCCFYCCIRCCCPFDEELEKKSINQLAEDELANPANELVDLPADEYHEEFDSPDVEHVYQDSSPNRDEVVCLDKKQPEEVAAAAAVIDFEADGSFTLRDDRGKAEEIRSPTNVTEGEEIRATQ